MYNVGAKKLFMQNFDLRKKFSFVLDAKPYSKWVFAIRFAKKTENR